MLHSDLQRAQKDASSKETNVALLLLDDRWKEAFCSAAAKVAKDHRADDRKLESYHDGDERY